MKRITIYLIIAAFVTILPSCGGKKTGSEQYVANEVKAEKPASIDVIAEGERLVKASDCRTCHHKTNRIVGPSHTEVAQKYEFTDATVKMLAQKIISGGVGAWGEVPMVGHSDVSQADAELMAKYVLSLDGEKLH